METKSYLIYVLTVFLALVGMVRVMFHLGPLSLWYLGLFCVMLVLSAGLMPGMLEKKPNAYPFLTIYYALWIMVSLNFYYYSDSIWVYVMLASSVIGFLMGVILLQRPGKKRITPTYHYTIKQDKDSPVIRPLEEKMPAEMQKSPEAVIDELRQEIKTKASELRPQSQLTPYLLSSLAKRSDLGHSGALFDEKKTKPAEQKKTSPRKGISSRSSRKATAQKATAATALQKKTAAKKDAKTKTSTKKTLPSPRSAGKGASSKKTAATAKPVKKKLQGRYVGSIMATTFHTSNCEWINNIKRTNKVWFTSKKDAEKKGYHPHECVIKK